MSEEEKKVDETALLLDGIEVAGYKVKPWGICDLAKLSPSFERIYFSMKERKIELGSLSGNIDKVIFAILPEAPHILAITLKVSIDEIEKLSPEKVMPLMFSIINMNMAYLKNWLSPLTAMVKQIVT
jgi:hypothetical protein